jgi:hypothetical protein
MAGSRHRRAGFVVFTAMVSLWLAVSLAAAYGEEAGLYFVDPATGQSYTQTVSSIHFDLAYSLAICAGFREGDARTIQLYSQMTDDPELGPYTLSGGPLPETPPSVAVCRPPVPLNVVFPISNAIECSGCFTSRFGPFSAYFHFPHDTPEELGQTRAWAYGEIQQLRAPAEFAYGGTEVVDARCIYTPTVTIDTGTIQPGSLQAFGIYLHSLGDTWSHKDCVAALDAGGEPWGTHTNEYPACGFTDHTLEFGPSDHNTDRTLAGVQALYQALKTRSSEREGVSPPVNEQNYNGWLNQQLASFVHDWGWGQGQQRRGLAQEIADSCTVLQACPDFNDDGSVNTGDIQASAAHWQQRLGETGWEAQYDRNDDGQVDIRDIMMSAKAWGQMCTPS